MPLKLIPWDERKNVRLKQRRGVSFENILGALADTGRSGSRSIRDRRNTPISVFWAF